MLHPEDTDFMARALALAEHGRYTTTPNPSIGCVIVRDGRVLGEGFTQPPGGPHAEISALRDAAARGESVHGATVYATLEPCSHFGRTPPGADALIAAGVARVVSAMVDPNPQVDGTGNDRLRAAGIAVTSGVLAAEAAAMNRGFISRHRRGRPWVRVKLAMSLDGRTAMASGESKWITGPQARADVQHWRARACAILTGAGTVLADDPELNVRELGGMPPPYRQPLRVVLDRRGRVPPAARVFQGGPALWIAGASGQVALPAGVERIDGHLRTASLPDVFAELARRECNEVLVEAGATLAGSVIAEGLCDELITYVAPKLLGDRARPLLDLDIERMRDAIGLALVSVDRFGDDVRLVYRRRDADSAMP